MPFKTPYISEDFNTGLLDNVLSFDRAIAYTADNTDAFEDGLPEEEDFLWFDNDDGFFPDAAA